mmetsp:Transcript_14454/g.58523  ORF Transcript_14454/g.58523 Transcript_14454/m.58523 type:complete len:121 (-) Transcript_14454:2944-3306(-)
MCSLRFLSGWRRKISCPIEANAEGEPQVSGAHRLRKGGAKEVVCLFAGNGFRYSQDHVRERRRRWIGERCVYYDELESDSPGMVLTASIVSEHVTECFSSSREGLNAIEPLSSGRSSGLI